ncbi:MAG: UDP-N-acetylglucosamine 1-carboxyvinyltransferase, partial [Kangiellaceae bacterium]|nr:UDP-N-acetylglucosamine 1-carboxyvinyltransferase [Kangiellaceae bacterium]
MQKFQIRGGHRLKGSISISGAKNAALPILMTSLLSEKGSHFSNVPSLDDVETTLVLLRRLGVECSTLKNSQVTINPYSLNKLS